ncbi:cell division protein FtsA, partial [bacterium]|nr:cell division protein FtsA [bacterium]
APSTGLSRGMVVNPGKTLESIKASVKEAEERSGYDIKSVTVGIAGPHIRCIQSEGIVAISHPDRIITEDDIERLYESAKSLKLSKDEKIIDVIPQEFIIDSKDGIFDLPIGMFGLRMEAKVNILTGLVSQIDDLSNCVQSCGVDIDDIVLEPLASSYAVLNESEKKVGVAMIDIGGGTTDIAVFFDGSIRYTDMLGLAGQQVTSDISICMKCAYDRAEELKKQNGSAMTSLVEPEEIVEIPSVGGRPSREVLRKDLAKIIEARMEEIFNLVLYRIKQKKLLNVMNAGVVLTGGGSMLDGTVELATQVFQIPVRIGYPRGFGGLMDVASSPIYATGVGLIHYGVQKDKFQAQEDFEETNEHQENEMHDEHMPSANGDDHHTGHHNGDGQLYSKIMNRMTRWMDEFF